MSSLPWVEKYRPASLDDLVSHKDIISTITTFMDQDKLPHLLLYGPPGTGKTSTILACARTLYGNNFKPKVLELNASDDRGIDAVREQIKTFASSRMTTWEKSARSVPYKLIILDEADALTQQAQNALRRVIEQYTKTTRFCLICNYVNKIIPALQSRCTRFRFAPLEIDQIDKRLQIVLDAEGVNITSSGKEALLELSKGDMRKALNILQSCHAANDLVDQDAIYQTTGSPHPSDIKQILDWLLNSDFTEAYSNICQLQVEKGLAVGDILTHVFKLVSGLDMPQKSRIYLVQELADIEYNLTVGCSDKIQLSALVGAFKNSIDMTLLLR
ncbi:hypothetical protein HDV06_006095 [Boothiomyces sp. JEL0866]|nr:hypothetical protein HDV06_006045 [Boothiomyces sp. JEL0866]KAJ3324837.1 hypothetical protein HDV06_006095 [Boothiomyces sp. JEL0866]